MYQPLMKIAPHTSRIPNFLTGWTSIALTLFLAFTLAFTCTPGVAQSPTWQVDPQYSFARVSLGAGEQSQQIDVAPVSGKVVFDSNHPSDPLVDVTFKPGSGLGQQYSDITFRSKQTEITRDGKLAVIGDLSVTSVQPSAIWTASEAYSGPEYGQPVTRTETGEVTLVFPSASLPADQSGEIRLSASTTISREDFPQWLAHLQADNTHRAASDENCIVPSTAGEDYSGLICTGTPVATANGSVATIALTLKLSQPAPAPTATPGADGLDGH